MLQDLGPQEFDSEQEKRLASLLLTLFGNEQFTPGLDRIRALFEPFNQKWKSEGIKVVTIAGTNGKGETAHALSQMLELKKKKVCLWTSPHVVSARERFLFQNKAISYTKLFELIEKVRIELKGYSISYYEFLFLTFCFFADELSSDVIILEVGLGGRFDAVNLIDPTVTSIVSISRDHQEILGNSYKKILSEKLGITRCGIPLLSSFGLKYLRNIANDRSIQDRFEYRDLFEMEVLNSEMPYFQRNRIMAFYLLNLLEFNSKLEHLIVDHKAILKLKQDIKTVRGRFDSCSFGKLDLQFVGAHNLDGFRNLVKVLKDHSLETDPDEIVVAFSKRNLEEVNLCLKIIEQSGVVDKIVLTTFEHPRALVYEAEGKFNFVNDWKQYLETKKNCKGTVLVTGSYYFIGEIQKFILSSK